jgi:hypothetical protein
MAALAMNAEPRQVAGGKVWKPAGFPCAANSSKGGGIERGASGPTSQVEL